MELNWITKEKGGFNPMVKDVRFGFLKGEGRVSISIAPAAIASKLNGTEYIVFAISGNRIYFKEADSHTGYKLSRTTGQKSGTAQLKSKELADFLHKNVHIWDSNFRYDSTMGLYFVDASKRDLDWKENR